jgi:hypothetical protein
MAFIEVAATCSADRPPALLNGDAPMGSSMLVSRKRETSAEPVMGTAENSSHEFWNLKEES